MMNMNANRFQKAAFVIAIFFLAVNLLLLFWYLFSGYQATFQSDAAAKVLLAREIVETGKYFPSDFNYVNEDLWVLFGHTFIIPMLAFLPAGYLAHALSGLISSALILSGIWFITGLTQVSITRRLFIVATVASGISGLMAMNLFGQVSYGAIVYCECFILFFSYSFLRTEAAKRKYFGIALLSIMCLVFWSNPQRALTSYVFPLLAAIAWHWLSIVHTESAESKKIVRHLWVIIFIGIVLGGVLHFITLSGIHNVPGAGNARWLTYDLMLRNASLTLKGFLAIFGGLPTAEVAVVSRAGIYEAARLAAALAMLGLIPSSIFMAFRQKQSGITFIGVFALVAFVMVLFLQVTTTIPDMTNPIQSSRYLVPSLLLLMVFVFTISVDWLKTPVIAFTLAAVAACFVTSGYPTYVMSDNGSRINWGVTRQHNSHLNGVKDFLLGNGLHYGYATYWNAGTISVISDEKVLVRQIVLDRGLPMPMRHLSSNRWYRPSAWQGESFLLLTKQEAAMIDWVMLAEYHFKPVRELIYDDFRIFVFSQNIAKGLPGWDSSQPMNSALANDDFRARISSTATQILLKQGGTASLDLSIENRSEKPFSSSGKFPVNIGAHLLTKDGILINNDFARSHFLGPVNPHGIIESKLTFGAPPKGIYILEIDLVQEGVAWFSSRGLEKLRVNLNVN